MVSADIDWALRALSAAKGAEYAEIRIEDTVYESITVVNRRVVGMGSVRLRGAGVRVIANGALGFASTTDLTPEGLKRAVDEALKAARAVGRGETRLAGCGEKGSYKIEGVTKHPANVDWEEKLEMVLRAHDSARAEGIRSITARYAAYYGSITVVGSDGTQVYNEPLLVGIGVSSIAKVNGSIGDGYEVAGGSRGLEMFTGDDAPEAIGRRAAETALEKARAVPPPSGQMVVVIHPKMAGVFAHESFGHLCEADFVIEGTSPLAGRLGETIASEYVTIVDSGVCPYGGYSIPVDDEGVRTRAVMLVEKGVLKSYLHSRATAGRTGSSSTGNGRAQDYRHVPIVRMRNTYFEAGDWGDEEIVEDTKKGVFVTDSRGGQVDLNGTFTFTASRGYIIENGELKQPIRDVVLMGNILEVLKNVDAASKNVRVYSSPFGGCGKMGQGVFVGDGGPTLRVSKLTVGGRVE